MDIEAFTSPDDRVAEQIRELERQCRAHDGIKGRMSFDAALNISAALKSVFVLYDGDTLAAAISMFVPTAQEAEISAYTLPTLRRRGYFRRLFEAAAQELRVYRVSDLLFVCEPQSADGIATMRALGAELEYSEHLLKYRGAPADAAIAQPARLTLRKAQQADLEDLVALRQAIFDEPADEARGFLSRSLDSEQRTQYLAMWGERIVGLAATALEEKGAGIFGLGIAPEHQGIGLGRELVERLIQALQQRGITDISIEVESLNDVAFRLYQRCGFVVEASYGYYRKHLTVR